MSKLTLQWTTVVSGTSFWRLVARVAPVAPASKLEQSSRVRKQDSRVRGSRLGPFATGGNCLSIILQKSSGSAHTQAYGQLLTQVFGHETSSHGMDELRVMSQLPVRLGIPCRCQSRQLGQVAHRVPRHVFVCWRHRPHRGWSATRSTR